MGYSGFGYQKWISSQRLCKPFSKDRKPVGGTSGQTTLTEFNPYKAEGTEKGLNVRALLLIVFIISSVVYIGYLWNNYVKEQNRYKKERAAYVNGLPERVNKQLAGYLNKNASYYITNKNFNMAKQELTLANLREPNNIRTSELWALVYLNECNLGNNCDSATYFLNKHFSTFPNDTSIKMQSLKQANKDKDFARLTTLLLE